MQQKASKTFTYQTRLNLTAELDAYLTDMATLLSKIERKLFVDRYHRNISINELKKSYIKNYKITARHFNSIRIKLEGKVKSCLELLKERIPLLKTKIKKLEKHIKNLKDKSKIHQKKRRLNILKLKLKSLEEDYANKIPRICFGSNKLFKKQFQELHETWVKDWREKRNDSFSLIGSKDESSGNQSCQIMRKENSFFLQLRLPNCFSDKTIMIKNIKFAYGEEEIIQAIEENIFRKNQKYSKKPYAIIGKAINFLFKKDKKGWRIFVSIEKDPPSKVSQSGYGMIGIDINANHIALAETDRFGNIIDRKKIKTCTYGKTKNQSLAIIGDSISQIVKHATEAKKPIVLENLKFDKKKQDLREKNKKYSRMLSSFSYNKIITHLENKSFKMGIKVYKVNPAYTSIIGRVKFAARYGLSIHQASALTIARRVCGYSEKLSRCLRIDSKNFKSAFFLPVRNQKKHVWSLYSELSKMLKAVGALQLSTIIRSIKDSFVLCDSTSLIYRRDSGTLIVNNSA